MWYLEYDRVLYRGSQRFHEVIPLPNAKLSLTDSESARSEAIRILGVMKGEKGVYQDGFSNIQLTWREDLPEKV